MPNKIMIGVHKKHDYLGILHGLKGIKVDALHEQATEQNA